MEEIRFGANDSEVYFEEDDFDGFLAHLAGCADVVYVRPPLEHRWGRGWCGSMTRTATSLRWVRI